MAVVPKTLIVGKVSPSGRTYFAVSASSADAQSAEVAKAAPTAGSIYLEHLVVQVHGDILVDIGDGEDSSAVETIALQLYGTAEGSVFDIRFIRPIKLTAVKALTFDASGAGPISILAEGFVA